MSYTITMSHHRGYISDAERDEWFNLCKSVGLTVDHSCFDLDSLYKSVEAIKKTRDGLQRFVLAKPIGTPVFANDISDEEFDTVLQKHKAYVAEHFPETRGVGTDAYADAGDLGVEVDSKPSNHSQAAPKSAAKSNDGVPLARSLSARQELNQDKPIEPASKAIAA